MSVLRFFSGLFAADTPRSDWVDSNDHWIFRTGPSGMRTDTGLFVSERLALNLTAVQACVGLIADTMAMIPVAVERENKSGSRFDPVDNDPREHCLNVRPNELMTPIGCRKTIQSAACLWGNGYAEPVYNGAGQAVELWPLPPGTVAPVQIREASGSRVRYRGSVAGQQFDRPADEVIHLRGLTLDGLCGLSPIAEARQTVGLSMAVEKFGAKFYANDLKSGGYVSGAPENLTEAGMANLREYLNAQGGLENAHAVKILTGDMKFWPGVVPPEDAQFLGTREFTVAEFARMFRVPLELLAAQGKTSSWGSGIEQLFIAFVRWTLEPWVRQWEQELTLKLLTDAEIAGGLRIRFKVKELLRGDSAARASFYERMVGIKAMTVNEVRAEEGRNPVPWGEEFEEPQPPAAPPSSPTDREREDDVMRKEEEDTPE